MFVDKELFLKPILNPLKNYFKSSDVDLWTKNIHWSIISNVKKLEKHRKWLNYVQPYGRILYSQQCTCKIQRFSS